MKTITVRPADMSDHATVSALYNELFAINAALQPGHYKKSGDATAYVTDSISRDDRDILLAESAGDVVGFALVLEEETQATSALVPHRFARLMDLVVWPQYRGQGVGAGLIEAVKDWAAARQLEYLELTVLAENEGAIRMYRREGFETVHHTMRCPLTPPRPTILN